MILRPPQWAPGKKFPVVLLIHGGPQVPWLDQWHGRWNYQMFAAPGYGLVIINPRGSPGYGQKFVDAISKDWGGAVYSDLMLGLDAALAKDSWLDSTRMGAAGGSYGGYMVDWIAGHSDRFKALVSHAGPYNLENMYGATEELWFPDVGIRRPVLGLDGDGAAVSQVVAASRTRRTSRRRRSSRRVSSTIACRTPRISRSSARCSGRAFRRGSSCSRMRDTGCRSRRTRSSGGAKCRAGSANICSRQPCERASWVRLSRGLARSYPDLIYRELRPAHVALRPRVAASRGGFDARCDVCRGRRPRRVRVRRKRQQVEQRYAAHSGAARDTRASRRRRVCCRSIGIASAPTTRRICS